MALRAPGPKAGTRGCPGLGHELLAFRFTFRLVDSMLYASPAVLPLGRASANIKPQAGGHDKFASMSHKYMNDAGARV
eukprot:8587842-Heterocapsa_arctica.AAC.1